MVHPIEQTKILKIYFKNKSTLNDPLEDFINEDCAIIKAPIDARNRQNRTI